MTINTATIVRVHMIPKAADPSRDVSDILKGGMAGRILTNVNIWKCGVELVRRLGIIHLSKRDYFLLYEVVLACLTSLSECNAHARPANKHSSKRGKRNVEPAYVLSTDFISR